ncbi:MAG: hypothetical protein WBW93_12355 [Steroidobacteraceae bacterium]
MENVEEPALFKLTAHEATARLDEMFAAEATRVPYRVAVAAALMLAEAATQKITVEVFSSGASERLPPQSIMEGVERLTKFYFEGTPMRIDLVMWDAEGYIFGWCTDQNGQPYVGLGSFPDTVSMLAQTLRTLAACTPDWREPLERHAATLEQMLAKSRKHAELVARQRVASQGWLSRFRKPMSVGNEMLSLGFPATELNFPAQ